MANPEPPSGSDSQMGHLMGWLVPVGTPGGINSGFDKMPDGSGLIRLGSELICLECDLYRLWTCAARAPQRAELVDWAATQSILRVDEGMDALQDAGLLVGEHPGLGPRADRVAIRLIGEMVGNGSEGGPEFTVLGRDGIHVQLDPYLFDLLLRTDGVTPLSAYSAPIDKIRTDLGHRGFLEALSAELPLLVRTGVIRLDGAIPSGQAA